MMKEQLPQVSNLAYTWHAQRRALSNFSFRRHRRFDAYLVTMHQSGTHWLKYLLTLMLTRELGLEMPATINENTIIGGPREVPRFDVEPRLGHSHTIPSPLLNLALAVPVLGFPNYLVLVRDIRDVLIAHYQKWQAQYACSFAEFLRGDVSRRRFEKDLWWDFRFMNAWGAICRSHPQQTKVLRYEALREAPEVHLREVVAFLQLPLANIDDAINFALAGASKQTMMAKDAHAYGMPVVNLEARDWGVWYTSADRAWFAAACRRHLKYDFGYDYAHWE